MKNYFVIMVALMVSIFIVGILWRVYHGPALGKATVAKTRNVDGGVQAWALNHASQW